MTKTAVAAAKAKREDENLPVIGTAMKRSKRARRDMDRREREVFELRRDGLTLQEISDRLFENAERIFNETGKRVAYFSGVSSVKMAYDRYMARAPERFDVTGRKEQLELAIRRAEENYTYAREQSHKATGVDKDGIYFADAAARARWSEQAGKWYDRLTKLRALIEDTTIINNFNQNNLIVTEAQLVEKLQAKAVESTRLEPNLDAYKSADTVPPMIEAAKADVEDAEIVVDDEFAEPEELTTQVEMAQPTGEVKHEEIKAKTALSTISFIL